jgi:DNA-binding MarR family transcriptional regulator
MAASKQRKPTPEAVAAELLSFWHYVMKRGSGDLFALLTELDLSITQIKTLNVLDSCVDQVSVKELAERMGMSLPGASRTVDRLLRRGWLERREDEQDRRIKRVGITAEGRAIVHRIETARLQGLEHFAGELDDEQRRRLLEALAGLPHTETKDSDE